VSEPAIKVQNLSKQYRIGTREGYKTFREALVNAVGILFQKTAKIKPNSGILYPQPETIWALQDVSFEVKRGEIVGIIGRNGAGKTTLLKILSKITDPTEGRVELRGRVGSLLEVGIGFHPELTGHENVYLYGAILGMDRWEVTRKFDEIVAFAELEKFIDTPVKRYSSGMYMRLAFAVAAHLEPEILLVDEVLAVGDTAFQKKCLGKMGNVAGEGRTVLFVSHNMAAVEQLCSRAILLSAGHIEKSGKVDSVIKSYLSSSEQQYSITDDTLARSSDGTLELISIGPVDEKGNPMSVVQCGMNFNIAMLLRTTESLPKLTVSIGINSLYDLRVAVLHSSIAGYDLSLTPGLYSIICRVPHFPLSSGSYFLDVKVLSSQEVILWTPRLIQLSVESGDFYKTGKLPDKNWGGVLNLHQQWEVRNEQVS